MPDGAVGAREELAPVYAAALEQPGMVLAAADAQLRRAEAREVVESAFDSLWHTVFASNSGDDAGSLPLDPAQKSWLLLHAGLLRGFNLAVITTWRPSGDTLALLDEFYPGFVGYGEALHRLGA